MLRADAAYILQSYGPQVEVVATTTRLQKLLGTRFPATTGLASQLHPHRQGRIFNRQEIQQYAFSPALQEMDSHSILLVPLIARDVTLGALGVVRGVGAPEDFTSADLELMSAFAGRTAAAIDTAQLLQALSMKNEQLALLIEEAHHRIKNNLQMVSGLLQLEATDNRAIAPAIARIQAIAKVHNLLSREMPDNVDASALITSVLSAVTSSAATPPVVQLNLAQVWLTPDQATAVALVVNELSSNAIIHAHPKDGEPVRLIVRCWLDGNQVHIQIRDNGGGLPTGFDYRQSSRQGMTIIHQLAQTNLRGKIELQNRDGGLCSDLTFQNAANDSSARA